MEESNEELNPIQKICPWARKHMAAEVRLRIEQNLRSARIEEARLKARREWFEGVFTRHLTKPGGVEGAIKMAEESVACAYAAWMMLKRADLLDYKPKMIERLGELEFLVNHVGAALSGIKSIIGLEKWRL